MFVACGIWCLADVSSVSPSSELVLVNSFSNYTADHTLSSAELFFFNLSG